MQKTKVLIKGEEKQGVKQIEGYIGSIYIAIEIAISGKVVVFQYFSKDIGNDLC